MRRERALPKSFDVNFTALRRKNGIRNVFCQLTDCGLPCDLLEMEFPPWFLAFPGFASLFPYVALPGWLLLQREQHVCDESKG